MPRDVVFKQKTLFDVSRKMQGVEGGGWLSKLASYAGATLHRPREKCICATNMTSYTTTASSG